MLNRYLKVSLLSLLPLISMYAAHSCSRTYFVSFQSVKTSWASSSRSSRGVPKYASFMLTIRCPSFPEISMNETIFLALGFAANHSCSNSSAALIDSSKSRALSKPTTGLGGASTGCITGAGTAWGGTGTGRVACAGWTATGDELRRISQIIPAAKTMAIASGAETQIHQGASLATSPFLCSPSTVIATPPRSN